LPLIEYNVFRAVYTNILILGNAHIMGGPCLFSGSGSVPFPHAPDRAGSSTSIPAALRPTPLQQSAPHAAWIDVFPSPKMRDNMIRAQREHLFTSGELCADVLGGLSGKQNDVNSGLIVWSDPWEPGGWELTEGFIGKWKFLIKGCNDLVESTNGWRDVRGEDRLILEID
jgi:hypothetical protein